MDILLNSGSTLVIIAAVVGLFMAWGIGANDVANAMGTSFACLKPDVKFDVFFEKSTFNNFEINQSTFFTAVAVFQH